MPTIGGIDFTTEQSKALAMAALAAAKDRGYCGETRNVLNDMGLVLPRQKVTIEVEVDYHEYNDQSYYWNITHDLVDVVRGEFNVVNVEDVVE